MAKQRVQPPRRRLLDGGVTHSLYCAVMWRIPPWGWLLGCLGWLCCQGVGCSPKNQPQYPEDHQRFVLIDAAVESLRTAYIEKNYSQIKQLMVPGARLDRLGKDIQQDFRIFEEISLDFSIDRIMVDGDTVDVFLRWHGYWKGGGTGLGRLERGHGMLSWVGVQSVLLKDVQGDLPFGIANRVRLPESGPGPGF